MGSVSIEDMAAVAQNMGPPDFRMSEDIGNVIDIGGSSLGDDLGLNMIANLDKMDSGGGSGSGGGGGGSYSVPAFQSSSGGGDGGLGGIELTPLEPLEPISIGGSELPSGAGDSISFRREESGGAGGSLFSNSQSATGPGVSLSSPILRDPEAEKREKVDYLNKLQRLEQKGFPVAHKFTMDNSLEEIKQEYMRLVDARQLETSIKFQRQMLMGAITGLEWLNGRFDPFDLKLDGWSESVHENVEDFDEIFEELYDKYKDRGKMSPEMRLLLAVGGSGFMCHVSNSFFRQKMPSMDDVLRRNPDLARQMATAAAQSAGPGFGNFMGMAMGMQGGGGGDGGSAPIPAGPPGMGGPSMSPAGAFFEASPASARPPAPMSGRSPAVPTPEARPTARKEMRGPSGVDDILRTFEEVRRAELSEQRAPPSANGMASQPAVAAAELASLHSEDMASQADTVRTGATGGRRRRRAQPPVGNTVSLNV